MSLPIPNIRKMLRLHFGTRMYKLNFLGEIYMADKHSPSGWSLYGYVDDNPDTFCIRDCVHDAVIVDIKPDEPRTESYLNQIHRELTPKPMFEII